MSSHHHIRLATSHRIVSGGSDDETVGDHGNETVNVGSKINLDEVSVSQVGVGFTEEGGVVADDVIDGDTRGEGNTCKYSVKILLTFSTQSISTVLRNSSVKIKP